MLLHRLWAGGCFEKQERCLFLFLETQMKIYESGGVVAGQYSPHNLVAEPVTRITRDDAYQGLQKCTGWP